MVYTSVMEFLPYKFQIAKEEIEPSLWCHTGYGDLEIFEKTTPSGDSETSRIEVGDYVCRMVLKTQER